MPRYSYIVMSNPTEGREDEYNEWYDTIHLQETIANVRGVVSARRLRLAGSGRSADAKGFEPWRYVAIYEVDAESPEDVKEAFRQAFAAGLTPAIDAFDMDTVAGWYFEPIGSVITSEDVAIHPGGTGKPA